MKKDLVIGIDVGGQTAKCGVVNAEGNRVDKITSKDIYEAACQGDELAIRVLTYTGTLLGQKLGDFIAFSGQLRLPGM